MKKVVLILASNLFFHSKFNGNLINVLVDLDYEIHLGYDSSNLNYINKSIDYLTDYNDKSIHHHEIVVPRNIYNIYGILISYFQFRSLVKKINPNVIHLHTPIIAFVARFLSKKLRYKISFFYTVHGFHFNSKSRFLNFNIFYLIERYLSRFTDTIITINKADYELANSKMNCKSLYIPGIGVDIYDITKKNCLREKLSIVSIGELNKNKNYENVIKALKELPLEFEYFILGEGARRKKIIALIRKLGLESKVFLTGFKDNVYDYLSNADFLIHPSKREGLSVSMMEAMMCRLPILCSNINGNRDLIDESLGGFYFKPKSYKSISNSINRFIAAKADWESMGNYNYNKLTEFSSLRVKKALRALYLSTNGKTNE